MSVSVMAVIEEGFPVSGFPVCTIERGDKEHCCFKEIHLNYFADRLWQVIEFSVVALCF